MNIIKNISQLKHIKYFGEFIIKVSRVLFNVAVITFIGYFILEYLKTGIISNYFDMNLLLVISVISGFILIAFDETAEISNFNGGKLFVLIIISLMAGLLSYQYLQILEKVRYFIPPLTIITVFITIYLHQNKDYD